MNIRKFIELTIITIFIFIATILTGLITFQNSYLNIMVGLTYYIVLISIIFLIVTKYEKRDLDSLGFNINNISQQIFYGIIMAAIIIAPPMIRIIVTHETYLLYSNLDIPIFIYNIVFNICFVGFGEEVIMRGYLLTRIKEIFNSDIIAIISSSIIFGLFHYPSNHDIYQVINAIIIGLVLATFKTYFKCFSIIPLIIGHGLYDTFIEFII